MEQEEMGGGLEVLEADLAELENSVFHLVRSNVELARFLEEEPGDEDLEQALKENKAVLVKKRHRVKALQYAISDLKSQRPHLAAAIAPSTSAAAPIAAGSNMAPASLYGVSAGGVVTGGGDGSGTAAHPVSVGESATISTTARTRSNYGDGETGDTISDMTASMTLGAVAPPPTAIPLATVALPDRRQGSGTGFSAGPGGGSARSGTAGSDAVGRPAPGADGNTFDVDVEGGVVL